MTAIIEAFDRDIDERGLTDARGKERYIVQLRERFSRQLLNAKDQVAESLRQSASPALAPAALDERAIARDQARGLTWRALAKKYGVSETECQAICASARQRLTRRTTDDIPATLEEVFAALDAAIEDYVTIFETSTSDAVRARAVKARVDAQLQRVSLLKEVGLLPHDPAPWQWRMDMERLIDALGEVFREYDLPLEAVIYLENAIGGDGVAKGVEGSLNSKVSSLRYWALPEAVQKAKAAKKARQEPRAS